MSHRTFTPEFTDVRFDPEDLHEKLIGLVAHETLTQFISFGVYPPYLQILVAMVSEHSKDGVFHADVLDKLVKDGIGPLLGMFLHRRLDDAENPTTARAVLQAVVDVTDGGRKGRAQVADIAIWTGTAPPRRCRSRGS